MFPLLFFILPLFGTENILLIFDTVYGLVVGVFAVIGMIVLFKNKTDVTDKNISGEQTQTAPLTSFFGIGAVFVIVLAVMNILLGLV